MKTARISTSGRKIANQTLEPKRLSKIGQWRKNNPGGIIEVIDRRAVNR